MNNENQNLPRRPNNGHGQVNPIKRITDFKATSYIADSVYLGLPKRLSDTTNLFAESRRQKDMLLFCMLIVLSGCAPNVFGIYFGKKTYSNLFGILGGPAATGKHLMLLARTLGQKIHNKLAEDRLNANKALKMVIEGGIESHEPILDRRIFIIPANISYAGVIHLLSKYNRCLIVESEVDTLRIIFQQKFGEWSDILRKAYHHEPISSYRKGNYEFIEINNVCMSMLLSGTPDQIKSLITSAENGLFSRICFYVYDDKPIFQDPFKKKNIEIEKTFSEFANEICDMYFKLEEGRPKEFRFTDEQIKKFNAKFPEKVDDYYEMTGSDGAGVVMRLGVMFFRIAMILTILRSQDGEVLICDDVDFDAADKIVNVLAEHSMAVMSTFPEEAKNTSGSLITTLEFLSMLPTSFSTKAISKALLDQKGISKRTTFRLLLKLQAAGHIKKVKFGHYERVTHASTLSDVDPNTLQ